MTKVGWVNAYKTEAFFYAKIIEKVGWRERLPIFSQRQRKWGRVNGYQSTTKASQSTELNCYAGNINMDCFVTFAKLPFLTKTLDLSL
jgi:hypothetical protein